MLALADAPYETIRSGVIPADPAQPGRAGTHVSRSLLSTMADARSIPASMSQRDPHPVALRATPLSRRGRGERASGAPAQAACTREMRASCLPAARSAVSRS
jgi:hypothetical protein